MGLSVSGPNQDEIIAEAMKITVEGGGGGDGDRKSRRLFDSVQCTYNVLEQRAGPALNRAREAGMDIIVKEGMANGRILRDETFLKICKRAGYEPDQLALGCVLAQDFEPRVLSGSISEGQLTSNLKAMEVAERLRNTKDGSEVMREVMETCVADSETYWRDRSALTWN